MFKLDAISRYRAQIYGVLALWIVALHLWLYHGLDFYLGIPILYPIAWLIACGAMAVDAFVILSGISLCWAYEKEQTTGEFMARRFMRVLPSALIIYGIYWVVTVGIRDGDWGRVIWQCMFLNPLVHDRDTGNWFITGILVMYLCYPAFHRLFCESPRKNRNILCAMVGWYVLCAFLSVYAPEWFELTEIILTRFPAFMLGTYLGPIVREGRSVSFWLIPVAVGLIVFTCFTTDRLAYTSWLWRIPLLAGGLACVYLLTVIFYGMDTSGLAKGVLSPLWRFLGWVGGFSLELYCAHQVCRWVLSSLLHFEALKNGWLALLLVYAVSIPIAWAVNRFVAYVRARHETKLATA